MAYIDQIKIGSTTYDLNAATLAETRYIDGVGFDGSADIIHYGVCSTAAATVAKTVTISEFTLTTGAHVTVKFTYANTATSPTLNVNSTGAKTISMFGNWRAGDAVEFVYDGTYWVASSGYLGKYDDTLAVIKITDASTTMGDMADTLTSVNSVGDHVVFDTSALNAGMYLCTIYLNSGYYRVMDLVTGFEGTGFYTSTDTLYDILTSGSSTSSDHYTVCWDKTNATCTRLNAASSITTTTTNFGHFGSVNSDYDNPFDDIYPWSDRKLCNINIETYMGLTSSDDITDCITCYEDDSGFTYSDTYGVWVYTPPFYGRSYEIGNYRYFDVTEENLQNNIYYPAMITGRWHGVAVTLTLNDVSTVCNIPTTGISMSAAASSLTLATQHTYAQNYGATLEDVYALDASTLLYIVEYANMNSQAAIGNGVSDLYDQASTYPAAAVTSSNTVTFSGLSSSQLADFIEGAIIDFGTSSGGAQTARTYITGVSTTSGVTTVTLADAVTVTTSTYTSIHGLINVADEGIGSMSGYIGTNGKCNAYYRGEVLYGNKWQYILGAYRQTSTGEIYVAADTDEADSYDALDTSVHTDTGLALPTVSTANWYYIGSLGLASGFSTLPVETATGGSSSAPVGDAQYIPLTSAGNTVLLCGGYANSGSPGGAFCAVWGSVASVSSWANGSRPRLKNPS